LIHGEPPHFVARMHAPVAVSAKAVISPPLVVQVFEQARVLFHGIVLILISLALI
jgi:hypothetical protein